MRHILSVTAAAVLAAAPPLHSQHRPDFSGTWVLDHARSTLDEQAPEVVRSLTVVITQRGDELLVTTVRDGLRDPVTYTVGPVPPGKNRDSHGVIVSWEGQSLRTVLARMVSDSPVSIMEERQLSAAGREMVVRRQLAVEHGYQGQGVNTSEVVTDVYVRQAP